MIRTQVCGNWAPAPTGAAVAGEEQTTDAATEFPVPVGRRSGKRVSAAAYAGRDDALQLRRRSPDRQRQRLHTLDAGEPRREPSLLARALRPLPEHAPRPRPLGPAQQ